MKIKYAILGSDHNPLYYEFWEPISKIWYEKFNIIPILGLITNEDSDLIKTDYGYIKKFKEVANVSVGLQAQIVRLFLPKYLDDICIISDIDMAPLSREYFIDSLVHYPDDVILIHSSDNPECRRSNEIPMCYNTAHAQTFTKLFKLENKNWEQFVIELNNTNYGWVTDQKYLYDMVNTQLNDFNFVFMNRGWNGQANKRIDRLWWGYNRELVKEGYYIDAHLLRPYLQNKIEIDNLLNLL